MPRLICKLLVVLAYGWAGSVSALPFTYDFGFIGEQSGRFPGESGLSGTGFFTISELNGAPGLDAFEFTGSYGLSGYYFDLSEINNATWMVSPTGVISDLSISAIDGYFLYDTSQVFELSLQLNSLSVSYDCNTIVGPGTIANCGLAARSSSYGSGGAFLTLRAEPNPASVPSTPLLFGAGLAGLYLCRKTRTPRAESIES
jgi:hypothetical protein